MSRATTLALATVVVAILGAIFFPAADEGLIGTMQHLEAKRLEREQLAADERAALPKKHKGQE